MQNTELEFHEGDFVEKRDGRVGYISRICHCEKCIIRGFYKLIIEYTDGTEEYITNYSVKNAINDFKRIGLQNFDEIKNSNLEEVIEALENLKKNNPDQAIIMETTSGTVETKVGNALIYEGVGGELIIDSE